jgi:DNA-binding LacI/PurR family transcriptional regulator
MANGLREVAARTGVSIATVSRALRGLPNVRPELREQVKRVAKTLGYEIAPLMGTVLSQVRRGRGGAIFGGVLAVVHVPGAGQPRMLPFQREIAAGARRRAAALGFGLEVFELEKQGVGAVALGRILTARGVSAVIVLHEHRSVEMEGFPWERFAAVELDYSAGKPALHTISIDHHRTLGLALRELARRGFKRPGLALELSKDDRLDGRWSGAFRAQTRRLGLEESEPLIFAQWHQAEFDAWVHATRPDVVIGHRDEIAKRLTDQTPAIGFFSLNRNESRLDVSGLDLRPAVQGSVAVDSVVAQLHRRELGPPIEPRTIMISGRWVDATDRVLKPATVRNTRKSRVRGTP